jgi:hypothetical protein
MIWYYLKNSRIKILTHYLDLLLAANKEYIEHLKKNNPDIEKSVITIRFVLVKLTKK